MGLTPAQERAKAGRGAITKLNLALLDLADAKAKARAAGWVQQADRLDTLDRELTQTLAKMKRRANADQEALDAAAS